MKPDARSGKIALVADRLMNPPPGPASSPDGLAILAAAGWGVMQLPAAGYPPPLAARMLAEVAEQVAEFRQHGYQIVVLGEADGLDAALAELGLPLPDQLVPATASELARFLATRPG